MPPTEHRPKPARLTENFEAAQALAQVGSWLWEIGPNVVLWSVEQCRIFGEDPATYEPSLNGYLSHFPKEAHAAIMAETQRTLEGHGDYHVEHAMTRPDGVVRFVAERGRMVRGDDGAPAQLIGTTQDITERKLQETELANALRAAHFQAALNRSIVENIPVGVFVKDIRDEFRVTLWNPAAERIFGIPQAAMLGKTAHDLWKPEQADAYLAADRDVAARKVAVEIPEEIGDTNGRGSVVLRTVKVPLRVPPDAEPAYLLGICEDITSRRRATTELKAAKDAAERASDTKSEFLASMSHEIRTPLNGVIGMAQLMMTTPLSHEQSTMMATLKGSGEILLALIDDILDYSKIEAGQMEVERAPFCLDRAIRDVTDLLRPQATEKGLALEVSFDPRVPRRIVADPRRYRQVLLNLVGNAIKFTSVGRVSIATTLEGDAIRTSVIDTGIGVPEEAHARIFERFSQADASTTRRYGGTGLGLAISRRLMSLMGGRLELESVTGRGSTFFAEMPLAAADPSSVMGQAEQRPSQPGVAPNVAGLRVLLVEDSHVNQLVGRKMLQLLGCETALARDGVECVRMVSEREYDVVLMDVHMPQMDGLEATRRIRALEAESAAPRLPIIAVSASAMQSDREAAYESGMDAFLTKPLISEQLLAALAIARERLVARAA